MRKQPRMARAKPKRKSAVEAVTARFVTLIEEQAAKMNSEEFKAAERRFNQIIEDARGSHR